MHGHGFTDRARLDDLGASEGNANQRDFPSWHFAMLNDEQRNAAIEGAIAALDLHGKTVFEIGTGSGIVALLFAKYGAERVFTCEMNPNLARIAEDIIANSAYRDRITVLQMPSWEVIDSKLLPVTPDVIFTETVDCGIVGEGYTTIRKDIRRLAGAHTLVLPTCIEQHGALVESPTIWGLNQVADVAGFDLSALNRFSTTAYFPVRAPLYAYRPLSRWQVVRTYDYHREEESLRCLMRVDRPGVAHGLITWFTLYFGDHVVSNEIGRQSHWHQAFHPFRDPRPVAAGDSFRLHIDDEGAALLHGPLALSST